MRVCGTCKVERDLSEFGTRKTAAGDRVPKSRCLPCDRIFAYAYRHHAYRPKLVKPSGNAARKKRRLARNDINEPIDLDAVVRKHGRWCYLCESEIEPDERLTLDHVVPISAGGQHHPSNLRPTHKQCNSRKSWRLLSEIEGLPWLSPKQEFERFAAERRAWRDRMLFERIA